MVAISDQNSSRPSILSGQWHQPADPCNNATGMPCGGSMRVYVEPFLPPPTLWLLGHGRVAQCVCSIGALMGFAVVVDDPLADSEHYPDAVRLLTDDMDYGELAPGPADFVVIATQHKGDHQSMQRALRSGAGHIALIA